MFTNYRSLVSLPPVGKMPAAVMPADTVPNGPNVLRSDDRGNTYIAAWNDGVVHTAPSVGADVPITFRGLTVLPNVARATLRTERRHAAENAAWRAAGIADRASKRTRPVTTTRISGYELALWRAIARAHADAANRRFGPGRFGGRG